jgi:uncharacterized membrane protein YbhN (UPF0104 family)
MMKKLKTTIKLFLLLLVLVISFRYIQNNLNEFKKIFDLNIGQFIIISAITLLGLAIDGWLFKILLQTFKINLKFKEWFGLTVINRYSNYLFIKGGPFVRGIYLKKIHGVAYKNFLLLFVFISLIQILFISLLSALSMLFNYFKYDNFNIFSFAFLILISIASLIPFFAPSGALNFLTKRYAFAQQAVKIWAEIKTAKKLIIKSTILTIAAILLYSFKIFIIYRIAFEPILFSSAIIIASTGMLSFFIALTPASLGIKEAAMSYAADFMGEKFATAAAVAASDRAITMIWIFGLGLLFSAWYSQKK